MLNWWYINTGPVFNCYVYRRLNTGFEARYLERLVNFLKLLEPSSIPGQTIYGGQSDNGVGFCLNFADSLVCHIPAMLKVTFSHSLSAPRNLSSQ
jgi:hypothetical protein